MVRESDVGYTMWFSHKMAELGTRSFFQVRSPLHFFHGPLLLKRSFC